MFRRLRVLSVPPTYSAFDVSTVLQILAQACFERSRIAEGFLMKPLRLQKYSKKSNNNSNSF